MKIKLPFRSLKSKILIYFLAIFLFFEVLTGLVCIQLFSNTLNKEVLSYTNSLVNQSKLSMDDYFNQLKSSMEVIACDRNVLNAMGKYYSADNISDQIKSKQEINIALADIFPFNSNIKDIIVTNNQGITIGGSRSGGDVKIDYNFYTQKWFPKGLTGFFQVEFTAVHPQDYYLFPPASIVNQNIVSIVIPVIKASFGSKKNYGTIICNLNINDLQEVTTKVSFEKSGFLLIMNNNYDVIYKPNNFSANSRLIKTLSGKVNHSEGSFSINENNKNYLVVFCTSQITGWKIIAMIPQSEISQHVNNIRIVALILIAAGIILVVLTAVVISGKITRPIVRLMKRMVPIEQGNLNIKLYDNSSEEMEVLTSRIDIMLERINNLNKDIFSYQMANKEMEIRSLQAQINPHFLYNTLQLVKTAAVCDRPKDVSNIVTIIGNMLRYSVYHPKEMVKISDELNHVYEYIEIQKYRYPNRFEYNINCPSELEEYKTLKMVLQPLVENAFIHGFRYEYDGKIQIDVETVSDGILFKIHDNGIGMSNDIIDELNSNMEDIGADDKNDSIGLKNVHDRIRLKFGKPYGVKIVCIESSGACIEVLIPKISGNQVMNNEIIDGR